MYKDSIAILLISTNTTTISLVESFVDNMLHTDLSFSVSGNDRENIESVISHEDIDLVVFDVENLDEYTCVTSKIILKNNISILFLLPAEEIAEFIKSDFNFSLVDYLIKPLPNDILKHKVEIYLQNILQKKASEYLLHAYDENVIASETNLKGIITYTSQAFCDISEYKKEELLGKAHNIVRHPDTPKEVYAELWETVQSGKQWRGEIKNIKKNGGFYWVEVTVSPEFNYNGEIIGYNSIRQDISSRKYVEQISLIDHLTQVYNKRYYEETLIKEISSAKRYKYNLSLLMIDIDLFKEVNDTYGHLVGDSVLKEFIAIVVENTRKSDIISRIGGEEFTIIVSNDEDDSVNNFAHKLNKVVEEHLFEHVNHITVSIGISAYIEDDTPETLFKRVDDAMYKAKNTGRNRVVRL